MTTAYLYSDRFLEHAEPGHPERPERLRAVMELLRSVPSQGRTLFLSIHQLTDASRVCDRLVLLSKGRVVGEGTVPELQAKAGLAEGGLEEIFLALT